MKGDGSALNRVSTVRVARRRNVLRRFSLKFRTNFARFSFETENVLNLQRLSLFFASTHKLLNTYSYRFRSSVRKKSQILSS